MRIFHIGEYVKGGVATYLREVIEYQIKQNCEVFLCMSDYVSELEFPLKSKNIIRYPYLRTPGKIPFAIYFIWKTINHIKPDIVHVHSTFAGVFTRIGLFILPFEQTPKVIYCAHGWSFLMDVPYWKKKIYSIIELILAYKTDLIINISKYEQEQAILFGIPPNKCVLIYNGLSESANDD